MSESANRGRPSQTGSGHWSEIRESGSVMGMLVVVYCLKFLGRAVTRPLLYAIVSYYFLANSAARKASFGYLRRVAPAAGLMPALSQAIPWLSYKHFLSFAEAIIDRIDCWFGRRSVTISNREETQAKLFGNERGFVILTSHLGNIEMCRALIGELEGLQMSVLVNLSNASLINSVMQKVSKDATLRLIDITSITPATAVRLEQMIAAGEAVVIAADRTSQGAKQSVSRVEFLGRTAPFPNGPYILASLLDCPVFTMFCMKDGDAYSFYFELFADRIVLPRKARDSALEEYASRFASVLASLCVRYPLQWYNFYDFWDYADER